MRYNIEVRYEDRIEYYQCDDYCFDRQHGYIELNCGDTCRQIVYPDRIRIVLINEVED